jgi:hypothetical protein
VSLVRFWLPFVVTTVGVVLMVVGFARGDIVWVEGGGGFVGAGLSVWLLSYFYLMSTRGETDRDDEDEARAYFDRHGRWPDDDASGGPRRPPASEPSGPRSRPPVSEPSRPGRRPPASEPSGPRRRPPAS